MTKTIINKVKRFIKDNDLDFEEVGSELNGNCTTLAGFICYVLAEARPKITKPYTHAKEKDDGFEIIDNLRLPLEANRELHRVYDYAFENCYENYWKTEEARDKYIF